MIRKETLQFLTDLAANNNKEWFEANKAVYEKARGDMEETVDTTLLEFGKKYPIPGITAKKAMFRIYRDVRFSTDKTPYKINFSAVLGPGGKAQEAGGLYFHVQPGESFVGTGYYMPSGEQIKAIRQEIDYNYDKYLSLVNESVFKKTYTIEGEKLKTTPKGFAADNPAIEVLRMKQLFIMHKLPESMLMSPKLPVRLLELFEIAQPLMTFLNDAAANAAPPEKPKPLNK